MVPGSIIMPIGLLIAGWTARADVHWIAPDIVSEVEVTMASFYMMLSTISREWRSSPEA